MHADNGYVNGSTAYVILVAMQPDDLNNESRIHKASSASPNPAPLSTQPSEKHPNNYFFLGVVAVIVVLVLAGTGTFIFTQLIPTNQAAKSDTVTVPKGWKSYTSKLFGVSFVTPKEWTVNEFDPTTDTTTDAIAGGGIAIQVPGDTSNGFTIRVSKGSLADISKQTTGNPSGAGYSITEKALKWQNYDATEIAIKLKNGPIETILSQLLYVQISSYVFIIPDKDAAPRSVTDGVITQAVYKQFTDSIRINRAVVEAHAKESTKSPTDTPA